MDPNISTALELLAIGMFTVFTILTFVVLIGNGIIIFVNKAFPEDKRAKKILHKVLHLENAKEKFSNKKLAAIVSAVDIFTGGKGKVVEIKKIKK